MTSKLTITREQATDKEIQMLIDSHENGTAMFMRTDAYYFMAKELQERRKAAMDGEPVAFINGAWTLVYYRPPKESGLRIGDKLYRHAQQPVVPSFEEWLSAINRKPLGWVKDAMREAYDACRAAMLQAGNSPVQPYCRPAQNSVAPEQSPIDHGYRPDCECTSCKATARICAELAGWIPVSERMPEDSGLYLCYVQDEYEFDISHFCFEYLAAHKKFDSAGINITHWMPLPAAPQEAK